MYLPPELIVFIIATLPVLERAAVPVGAILKLPIEATIFWSISGTMITMAILLKILNPISSFLMKRSKIMNRFFTGIFDKTRKKHSAKVEEIGAILLFTISSIPIPGAGPWTGALIAFLFNIPYLKALILIFLGVIVSTAIITFGVVSVEHVPGILNLFIGQSGS